MRRCAAGCRISSTPTREFSSPAPISRDVWSGRCFDNIFVERLWRSVKYEDIFLHDYETIGEVRTGLGRYFPMYNDERLHESLDYRTPGQVYFRGFAGGHA